MEEQLSGDHDDSSPASSQGSPRQACWAVEDPDPKTSGSQLKTPPPGFKEIARSFMENNPLG